MEAPAARPVSRHSPNFFLCLVLSLVLNGLVVLLLGRLWSPFAATPASAGLRLFRIVVLPPAPRPMVHPHRIPPRPAPKPRTRRVRAPRKATPERPHRFARTATPQAPSPHPPHVPAHRSARPGRGRQAGPKLPASAQPHLALPLPAAPPVTITAAPARIALLPALKIQPPSVSLSPLPALTPPTLPTTPAGGAGGQGQGAGDAQGSGSGHAPGTGQGGGGGPFGLGSGGHGTGEGLRHIVYVLDTSGSMASRIDTARQEIRTALAGLQTGETFNIITFSNTVHVFDSQLDPATPEMTSRASYFLSTLRIDGGTNLEGALHYALAMSGVNVVVLVTDGDPTSDERGNTIMPEDEDKYFVTITRRVRRWNVNRARIYTVGLVGKGPGGHDKTFAGTRLLRQIAHDSGGTAKIVSLGDAILE